MRCNAPLPKRLQTALGAARMRGAQQETLAAKAIAA